MGSDLSQKIKDLRAANNLTLEDVARQVGVGKSTVRKWETGQIANMRRDKISKLAAALHTTPAYLMGWENEESPTPVAEDGLEAKARSLFDSLPDDLKDEAVRYLEFLASKSNNQ